MPATVGVMDLFAALPISLWVALATLLVLVVAFYRHFFMDSWQGLTFILGFAVFIPSALVAASTLMVTIPATSALREYTGLSDVYVKCDSWLGRVFFPYSEGYVSFENGAPSKVARLQSSQCHQLRWFWLFGRDSQGVPASQLEAIHVLAHEAEHLKGTMDESVAECDSMRSTGYMAALLGGNLEAAKDLPLRYLTDVYPRMPKNYQSSACAISLARDLGLDPSVLSP